MKAGVFQEASGWGFELLMGRHCS